ncbi:hypothetical protein Pssp01_49940 [Pseudomonas sp. NBRC 100443]|nr:hypothetical protein Pssp01_49940 [Pseudomonas sp. NBRC 100443]
MAMAMGIASLDPSYGAPILTVEPGMGLGVSADNRERLFALRHGWVLRRAHNAYGVIRRLTLAPGRCGFEPGAQASRPLRRFL